MDGVRQGFWMVWNPQGRAPTFKHQSAESASREAERLARLMPGTEFHVLMSVADVRLEPQPLAWTQHLRPETDDEDLPF